MLYSCTHVSTVGVVGLTEAVRVEAVGYYICQYTLLLVQARSNDGDVNSFA